MDGRPGADQPLPGRPISLAQTESPPRQRLTGQTLLIDPGSGRDAVCGRLLVPVLVDGELRDAYVDIPPPTGWTRAQVDEMWSKAARLEAARVLRVPLTLEGRQPARRAPGVDWIALGAAIRQAETLNLRWPQRLHTQHVIAPTGAPRGREDGIRTERARSRPPPGDHRASTTPRPGGLPAERQTAMAIADPRQRPKPPASAP